MFALLILLSLPGCLDYGLIPAPPLAGTPGGSLDQPLTDWDSDPYSGLPDSSVPAVPEGFLHPGALLVGPDGDLPDGDLPFDDEDLPDDEEFGLARMTGGGFIDDNGLVVSHGFTLHCALNHHANNLVLELDDLKFKLQGLDSVQCLDDPSFSSDVDSQRFDTVVGIGWGTLSDRTEVDIWFEMTDAGEPGVDDHLSFLLVGSHGHLSGEGYLVDGNHRIHDPLKVK